MRGRSAAVSVAAMITTIALAGVLLRPSTVLAEPADTAAPENAAPSQGATTLGDWSRDFSLTSNDALDQPLSRRAFALRADEPPPPGESGPDWAGLGRDTAFLLGYQIVAVGILYALPTEISNWRHKENSLDTWVKNVSSPVWDQDSWWLNYLAHPYVGATYYIRARERGFDRVASFAYSALASAMFEFGVEAIYEQPSIQDLIVTPVAGAIVGALVFEPIRNHIKAKSELAWYDHAGLFLTDPIGALNGVLERLLGIKSDVRVRLKVPIPVYADQAGRPERQSSGRERMFGFEVSLPWP
jgi:hypothetical protein